MSSNSRREFFKKTVSIFPTVIGMGLLLDACNLGDNKKNKSKSGSEKKNNNSGNNAAPVSCDDLSSLDANDFATRKKLNYIEIASLKSKTCNFCALFIPPQNGGDCGNCSLIRGPIRSTGTCTYWTKKES
ncbi:MAG: hypothetical protein ACRDE8_04040 [Ginsengibacter sp.]